MDRPEALRTLGGKTGLRVDSLVSIGISELDKIVREHAHLIALEVTEPPRPGLLVRPEHADKHLVLVLRTVGGTQGQCHCRVGGADREDIGQHRLDGCLDLISAGRGEITTTTDLLGGAVEQRRVVGIGLLVVDVDGVGDHRVTGAVGDRALSLDRFPIHYLSVYDGISQCNGNTMIKEKLRPVIQVPTPAGNGILPACRFYYRGDRCLTNLEVHKLIITPYSRGILNIT
ncbi:hypothetical protein D3C78_1218460 [compost metagenome]